MTSPDSRTLNLGIVAHVDAGKTTLTEQLLFAAGAIETVGSVDQGSTQTDTLALERERGITIKSAVASFQVADITVNLIDTPGHPDFIAEVERVLGVLDSAILVVSAVEGVQAQTRILMRALQRLGVPVLIFVNKIDRQGSRASGVLEELVDRLTSTALPMGTVVKEGMVSATFSPFKYDDPTFVSSLVGLLGENDDHLLADYVNDDTRLTPAVLRRALASQASQSRVYPVFFGSAITAAGIDILMQGIEELLPTAIGETDTSLSGQVFKVERGPARDKIAYARIYSGVLRVRDRLLFPGDREDKVTAISVFRDGAEIRADSAGAGHICKLWGLRNVLIGDPIGVPQSRGVDRVFVPPTLESVVVPDNPDDKGLLHDALALLAEQDPLIQLRQDDSRGEIFLSLFGEVQKEVIQETLIRDFGVGVSFRETTTIHIERLADSGHALDTLGSDSNPFLATVGLRVDPAPLGTGIVFVLDVDVRSMPLYVYKTAESFGSAMEEIVRQTLSQGLHGWEVPDCIVTLTESGYSSPATGASDFRKLTPLVVMDALKKAGTLVCEPLHRFHLDGPVDSLQPTLRALARLRGRPEAPVISGSWFVLEGDIRADQLQLLQQGLRSATHGEGVLEFAFDRYEQVDGTPPIRPRSDRNPLNRKEYLLSIAGRFRGSGGHNRP